MLRGLHYFGASAMVLFIGIHVSRTFLMAAYKFPREMSWLSGAVLLSFNHRHGLHRPTAALGSGRRLVRVHCRRNKPDAYRCVGQAVAHFILAGNTVGGATLSRFFAYHVFFVPMMIFGFVGAHLYLVLRNGISEPPKAGRPVDPKTYRSWYENMLKREGHPFWPNAAWRDVVFSTAMIVVLVGLAWFVGAPHLAKPPDPTILNAQPRPDWYLLWYFALLALLPHALENYFIILGPLVFVALLLVPPLFFNKGERSPLLRPWAIALVMGIWTTIGTLWIEGEKAPWSPDFTAKPLPASVVGIASGPVFEGAQLFHSKGCEYCHEISGYGGHRGPSLTYVGQRLTKDQITIRIVSGGTNMPAFGGILSAPDLQNLVAFLDSRNSE